MVKIGIDVDGVILDYMNVVRAYAELYDYCDLHKNGIRDREALKVKQRYDWTPEELKYFADKYFVELTKITPYNPLAIEIITRLKDEGYELYVISNRGLIHQEAGTIVKEMFEKSGLVFDKYFWETSDKTKVCLENGISIIIDDSPNVCEDAVKNGITALYFREKNSKKLLETSKLYDIDNWGEAYRRIKELTKDNGPAICIDSIE